MSSDLLLDTNAVIAWIERDLSFFAMIGPEADPVISMISVGELEYGVSRSARIAMNRERLDKALAPFRKITIDLATARLYGEIQMRLRVKGRPIPTNDVWIAALALQHGWPVITRDAHFHQVEGLEVRGW